MGPYLEWEKGGALKLSINLIVTETGQKYGWGGVARQFEGFDGMWPCVADRLNRFWSDVVTKGCSNTMYRDMVEGLKADFNHDALREFKSLFPSKETIGEGPGKITKKLWELGNKRKGGGGVDASDMI